ncbi:MAG: zf-HC2 domain-containing protein [Gemmatimonadales bacterium]
MPHLDEGMIHELLDGEIPSSQLPPLTAHLASCAECRHRLEQAQTLMAEADALVEILDLPTTPAVSTVTTAPEQRPRRWLAPVAWAASLAIAAGAGYAARGNLVLVSPPPVAVEAPQRAADSVAPTRPSAAAPQVLNQPVAKAAAPPSGGKMALAETAKPSAELRERIEAAPPAALPAPALAGAAVGALRDAVSGNAMRRADESRALSPRNAMTSKQLVDGSFADGIPIPIDTIQLADAMRLLAGHIRLIDGAVPKRLEAQGSDVRVIYPLATGELVLLQRLMGGTITWKLIAPSGFPADSLTRLRALVRE